MEVCLIEIKGADFHLFTQDSYHSLSAAMQKGVDQISNRVKYIKEHYADFRYQIHRTRENVLKNRYKARYLLGPEGNLLVDKDKDIKLRKVVIGEREQDEYEDSRGRTRYEEDIYQNIEIYSWKSFIRRLDPYHGHYFQKKL